MVDLRSAVLSLPAQEILTADGVAVRASLVVLWRVDDVVRWVTVAQDARDELYVSVQLALRAHVAGTGVDELLAARADLGSPVTSGVADAAVRLGVTVESVKLRDLALPADVKRAREQVVIARQQGQASLERARGETAALRSLANAAKALDASPGLRHLRTLQSLDSGSQLVLHVGDEG